MNYQYEKVSKIVGRSSTLFQSPCYPADTYDLAAGWGSVAGCCSELEDSLASLTSDLLPPEVVEAEPRHQPDMECCCQGRASAGRSCTRWSWCQCGWASQGRRRRVHPHLVWILKTSWTDWSHVIRLEEEEVTECFSNVKIFIE